MGRWKLWVVLLLPLTFHANGKDETLAKDIGRLPDVTPICTNGTENTITLIICHISTRSREEECRLAYRHGEGFEHNCDSRFKLMEQNQTVFLHLSSLTLGDSGNYSCVCSQLDGTNILHLNITVEPKENEVANSSTEMPFIFVGIGVLIFIIITGVILGFIHRKIHRGRRTEPLSSCQTAEPQDFEPYSTFIQRENGLYSLTMYTNNTMY